MARVFSQKLSSSFVGDMSIYSEGTESVYLIVQTGRTECLAGRPYLRDTRETQLSPSWPDSSYSSMCKAHESLRGMLSRELSAKTLQSSIV